MCEHFDEQLAWASGAERSKLLAEYQAWIESLSSDPDEAHPEVDVRDRAGLARRSWTYVAAVVAAADGYAAGEDVEPVELDNDLLLEQMQASMSAGW